jgi:hypothetical protein
MDRSVRTHLSYVREVRSPNRDRFLWRKHVYVGVLICVAFVLGPTAYHFHSSRHSTTSTVITVPNDLKGWAAILMNELCQYNSTSKCKMVEVSECCASMSVSKHPKSCEAELMVTDSTSLIGTSVAPVSIFDSIPPTITNCPSDRELVVDESGVVELGDLTPELGAQDICGISSVDQSPSPGTMLGPGTHEVSLTVSDIGGNMVSCTTTVRVLDIVLTEEEKVQVSFTGKDNSFQRLQMKGSAKFRDSQTTAAKLVQEAGGASLPASAIIDVAGVVIADLGLDMMVQGSNQDIWLFSSSFAMRKLMYNWKNGSYQLLIFLSDLSATLFGDSSPAEVHVHIRLGIGDSEHVMRVDVLESDWTKKNEKKWELKQKNRGLKQKNRD